MADALPRIVSINMPSPQFKEQTRSYRGSSTFVQKSEKLSPRQLRKLEFVSQLTTEICYVADAFPRILSTNIPSPYTNEQMRSYRGFQSQPQLQKFLLDNEIFAFCDTQAREIHPYILASHSWSHDEFTRVHPCPGDDRQLYPLGRGSTNQTIAHTFPSTWVACFGSAAIITSNQESSLSRDLLIAKRIERQRTILLRTGSLSDVIDCSKQCHKISHNWAASFLPCWASVTPSKRNSGYLPQSWYTVFCFNYLVIFL